MSAGITDLFNSMTPASAPCVPFRSPRLRCRSPTCLTRLKSPVSPDVLPLASTLPLFAARDSQLITAFATTAEPADPAGKGPGKEQPPKDPPGSKAKPTAKPTRVTLVDEGPVSPGEHSPCIRITGPTRLMPSLRKILLPSTSINGRKKSTPSSHCCLVTVSSACSLSDRRRNRG